MDTAHRDRHLSHPVTEQHLSVTAFFKPPLQFSCNNSEINSVG